MKQAATQTDGQNSRKDEAPHHKVRFSNINDVCESHELDDITYGREDTYTKDAVKRRYVKHIEDAYDKAEVNKGTGYTVDSKLKVDHQHYEQWARAPIKRVVNTILLRGIQQLKAKAKREAFNEDHQAYMLLHSRQNMLPSREKKESISRLGSTRDVRGTTATHKYGKETSTKDVTVNEVNTKDSITRDVIKEKEKPEAKLPRVSLKFQTVENPDRRNSDAAYEHQYSLEESGFSRALSSIRHPTKPGDINIVVDRHEKEYVKVASLDPHQQMESYMYRELPRSRYGGISRQRERSPFPVSVKQHKYHGEHVFLVSDPFRYREFLKNKPRPDMINRSSAKSENITSDINGLRSKLELGDIKLPLAPSDMVQDELYRSRSFVSSFPSKKQPPSRTLAQVPNVDFCDFSQLEDSRAKQYAFVSPPEKPRTESAFSSSKNLNLLKWVPRVQRMKELLK